MKSRCIVLCSSCLFIIEEIIDLILKLRHDRCSLVLYELALTVDITDIDCLVIVCIEDASLRVNIKEATMQLY